ncbi:uncharacterized protein [Battus philenor]|uniref:uncharacterized protein n=1 Tax=Battus philenor TaxID=42288 RepID=UPI0035CF1493
MAFISYLCTVLLCVFCVHSLQTFKALYCQDPDTGMLHPVNTTWAARSFCGNFTCKLRKKNKTSSDLITPIRKINITNININFIKSEEDMSPSASENINIGRKIKPGSAHLVDREKFVSRNKIDDDKRIESPKPEKEGDRYLTESEIKTITDMLHSVKKSDLEAIVDIYNLAQDIYKEMEKGPSESLFQESMTPIHIHNNIENKQNTINRDKQRVSYWYEPLNFHNGKVKPEVDITGAATTIPTTTIQPLPIDDNPNTYFKGSLTDKDFRKLPYYYPMSNFQRISSYTHTTKPKNVIDTAASEQKPCKKPVTTTNNYMIPSWINKSLKKSYLPVTPQNVFEPSLLLPFPFAYVNNNNFSEYPPTFYYDGYGGYPWAQLNIYNRNRNYQQSYLGTAYIARLPTESLYIKPNVNEEFEMRPNTITKDDIIDIITSLKDKEMKKIPEWQTNPLPEKVIEEVRANAEKSKIIKPLRKKVKIERVGKLIKLDENLRSKRSVDMYDSTEAKESFALSEEYETYITKTT